VPDRHAVYTLILSLIGDIVKAVKRYFFLIAHFFLFWYTLRERRDAMTLGRAIKQARAGLGWQQQQLAKTTGISQKYLSRVENDKADPSWSIVRRLIAALDLDLRPIAREEPDHA
jgi:DNA-binding XRE family transcriptional regulator